ncbi:MAG: cyclic nucleotide-binding domain-containing protein [Acidimicrobiia bacterium]
MEALRYLTDDERSRLLARADRRTFAAGEVIVREGEEHEEIYLLVKGGARIEKATPSGPVLIDELGAGEAFGEMSLLDGEVTHTSVITSEPSEVHVLELLSIADLLEEDPLLASHLYQSLAVMLIHRLRDRTNEVSALLAPGSGAS